MCSEYRASWATEEIDDLKKMAVKFFETEAVPNDQRWQDQKRVDREFWLAAGELGLLCTSIPEEYGGGGGTFAHDFAVVESQAYCGITGFGNQVHSCIVAPYILAYGTEEQKRRWLPKMASGEFIGAIAMTEPGAGSDLKAVRTTATRRGDHYVLNGAKTFISNAVNADLIIVVAKTAPEAGARGISLIVLETAGADGFRVGKVMDKIGMKAQDTAELFFDDVEVPAANLLGEENAGFSYLMAQLSHERLAIAAWAVPVMERAVEETVAYVKTREAFGAPLFALQKVRLELAECATIARVARTFVDDCIARHLRGELDAATASMAKSWATERQCEVVDRCLQLFGGYGYILDYPIAQMYADSRIQRIYGGTNDVLKELVARAL